MRKYLSIKFLGVFLFTGILLTVGFAYTFAHGGDSNLIHGCVRNTLFNTANLRIVGANENCNNNETPIHWPAFIPTPSPSNFAQSHPIICQDCIFNRNFEGKWEGRDFSNSLLASVLFQADSSTTMNMSGIKFDNSVFENTSFSGGNIDLSESSFVSSIFKSSSGLGGSDTNYMDLTNADFSNVKMTDTNIFNAEAENINFTGLEMGFETESGGFGSGNFRSSNFTNSVLDSVGFDSSDLTDAIGFSTATLVNVTWVNTICPDGTNSDNNGNTCVGHF